MINCRKQTNRLVYVFIILLILIDPLYADPCGDGGSIGPTNTDNESSSSGGDMVMDFDSEITFDATDFISDSGGGCYEGYSWSASAGTLSSTSGSTVTFTPPDPSTINGCSEEVTITLFCGTSLIGSTRFKIKRDAYMVDPYHVVTETKEMLYGTDLWCSVQTHEGVLGITRLRGYDCNGNLIAECTLTDCFNGGTYPRLCQAPKYNGSVYQLGYLIGADPSKSTNCKCQQ